MSSFLVVVCFCSCKVLVLILLFVLTGVVGVAERLCLPAALMLTSNEPVPKPNKLLAVTLKT